MKPINQVRDRYYAIAKELAAPRQYVQFSQTPRHDGSPHVEYEGDELLFVVTERGTKFEERRTKDPDELLFWLVEGLTWQMASDFELANRIESEDFRRQLFAKHLELMKSVNPNWASRLERKYDRILVDHPLGDGRG